MSTLAIGPSPATAQRAPQVAAGPASAAEAKVGDSAVTTRVSVRAYQAHTQVHLGEGQAASSWQKPVSGVASYQAVGRADEAPTANPYADRIVQFIDTQLRRDIADGASQADLQARLEAGLQGFVEGYEQAYSQLREAGWLTETVKAGIEQTYSQVLAGVSQLAEALQLQDPGVAQRLPGSSTAATVERSGAAVETASSAASRPAPQRRDELALIEALAENRASARSERGLNAALMAEYARGESRSFTFELTTQHGDRVTIGVSASRVQASQWATNGAALGGEVQSHEASDFVFNVRGELDEGELTAINHLLQKVHDLSASFFKGNLDLAFDKALDMGFDSEEIKSFALNLQMTQVERVNRAYQAGGLEPGASGVFKMADFVQQMMEATEMAESLGQNRRWVADLHTLVSNQVYQNPALDQKIQPFLESFL